MTALECKGVITYARGDSHGPLAPAEKARKTIVHVSFKVGCIGRVTVTSLCAAGCLVTAGTGQLQLRSALLRPLRLQIHRRPAYALRMEVDTHLDAVGDLDEGDAAIHPVLLSIEGHCARDRAHSSPYAGDRKLQGLGFRLRVL